MRWPNQVDRWRRLGRGEGGERVLPAFEEPEMIILEPLWRTPSMTCLGMGSVLWVII